MNGAKTLAVAVATTAISTIFLVQSGTISELNVAAGTGAGQIPQNNNVITQGGTHGLHTQVGQLPPDNNVMVPDGQSNAQSSQTKLENFAQTIFKNDTSQTNEASGGTYTLFMNMDPKKPVAGDPTTFLMNLYLKNGTWLWHSDFEITIKNNSTGQTVLQMPNIHGHGSLAEFTYVFPSAGKYEVQMIFAQQVGSPNYVPPHDTQQLRFPVNVEPAKASETGNVTAKETTGNEKEVQIKVTSWNYTPNKIEVNRGDHVRLIFNTADDNVALYNGHGFGIEGYNISVFLVKGATTTVDFIADKPGTFLFRCTSFCVSGGPQELHDNMRGTLVVS